MERNTEEVTYNTIRHAKFLARKLTGCSSDLVIRIALKETGIPSARDGFHYSLNAIKLLIANPASKLNNGIYVAVGLLRKPPAEARAVETAIRFVIRYAWKRRVKENWRYYFMTEDLDHGPCPTNREYLMAIAEFVELWQGCCEEGRNERMESGRSPQEMGEAAL